MRPLEPATIKYVADEIVRVAQDLQHYAEDYAKETLNVKDKQLHIDKMIEDIETRAQQAAEHIIRKVRLAERKLKND